MRFLTSEYDKIVHDIFNLLCHYEGGEELTAKQFCQYDALLDAYEALTRNAT